MVYIWHRETGERLEKLAGHKAGGCVSTISWNPADPGIFATGGDDGKVRIWAKESNSTPVKRPVSSHSGSYRSNRTSFAR